MQKLFDQVKAAQLLGVRSHSEIERKHSDAVDENEEVVERESAAKVLRWGQYLSLLLIVAQFLRDATLVKRWVLAAAVGHLVPDKRRDSLRAEIGHELKLLAKE